MIRILTLLVSLFTFGLVDLAEITYEIPVTDMLYFNDTPIAQLNNLTLNEIFRDNNLIINGDFDINLTNWTINAGTVVWQNGTAKISVETPLDFRQLNLTLLNSNNYYIIYKAYEDNNGSLTFGLRNANTAITNIFIQSFTINPQNYSYIFTTSANGDNLVIGRGSERLGNIYIDDVYLINLSSLGLTSLTQSQLDRYYELWQNPELNITYEINTLDIQDIVILLASQSVWTIMIHLLYKYAYRPKKKSKRLGM
jgi:hypothetical protein